MRRPKLRQRSRAAHKQRSRPWRWLGLGAIGLAIAALLRGERRPRQPSERLLAADPANDLDTPRLEPPIDVATSWVPGPTGSVRILERFPTGTTPIVFVHGLGGRAEQWAAQLTAIGPAVRGIALDLPGHGQSDPSEDDDYSMSTLAATIGAVVDSLRLRRFVLVGHSLGGAAAIQYAGKHPQRVAGLLLVDPNGDQTRLPSTQRKSLLAQVRRAPVAEVSWQFKQLLLSARPEVADHVLDDLETVTPEALTAAFESAMNFMPVPILADYQGPLHSVISDFNTLPHSLHRLLPDLSVSHIHGTSHWLMMDRPDELWAVLVDFLDKVAGLCRFEPDPDAESNVLPVASTREAMPDSHS